MDSCDALPTLIGSRIAARRAVLALTLEQLADRSGVSRAMISRIERGEAHASAVVLARLCGGLGLSLSTLFAAPEADAPPLRRLEEQPIWQDPESGYQRRNVSPPGQGSPVEITEIIFPAGAEVPFEAWTQVGIEQHVWLLEGRMDLTVGGTRHSLEPGDCLHLRLGQRTSYHNPGTEPARYAVILTMETKA